MNFENTKNIDSSWGNTFYDCIIRDKEYYKNRLREDPEYIKCIKDPDEELQNFLIKECWSAVTLLNNTSDDVLLCCVKQDPLAIKYVSIITGCVLGEDMLKFLAQVMIGKIWFEGNSSNYGSQFIENVGEIENKLYNVGNMFFDRPRDLFNYKEYDLFLREILSLKDYELVLFYKKEFT